MNFKSPSVRKKSVRSFLEKNIDVNIKMSQHFHSNTGLNFCIFERNLIELIHGQQLRKMSRMEVSYFFFKSPSVPKL